MNFHASCRLIPLLVLVAACQMAKPTATTPVSTDCIDDAKIDPQAGCTKEYRPVCGCNGRTYANPCIAAKAGLTSFTPGKCNECVDPEKIDPNKACPRNYIPVCGCDGRTYGNECEAQAAGVIKWKEGKCN